MPTRVCQQCGGDVSLMTTGRPEGRHGRATRDDYRCAACAAGGAIVQRNDEVVREVGPAFEPEGTRP